MSTSGPSPRSEHSAETAGSVPASLVSVIVPVFGVEPYLERCVDSLLDQSYTHLELILVDDGSPDRCGELCDAYALRDRRVRVIHQANAGVSAARNAGLDAAVGDLLMFVDSDDWVEADIVRHLVGVLEQHGAEIAVCGLRLSTSRTPGAPAHPGEVSVLTAGQALDLYAGPLVDTMTSPCGKVYRRALFEGIRFPVGRPYEDAFVTHRVVGRARTVALSSAELYHYCLRPDSATQRTQDAPRMLALAEAMRERASYFRDRGQDGVAAVSDWMAFLHTRHAAGLERAAGNGAQARTITRDARSLATEVARAGLPLRYRVLAGAYSIAPRPVDRALRMREHAAAGSLRRPRPLQERPRATTQAVRVDVDEAGPIDDKARHLEIIVVAYGSPTLLRQALEPVAPLAVTVVDNSSLADIEDLCAELGVRYLDAGHNGGFAAGVNLGLANRLWPDSDVLLLNPDATITLDGVRCLHQALLAAPDLASVGPAQVDAHGRAWRVTWPFHSPWGTWAEALALERLRRNAPGFVVGSVLLLRAEALEAVGIFDERFFLYFEETDWAYRAHRLGWRHTAVPDVEAVHIGGATSSDETRRTAHFHGSQERYFRKHFGAAGWQAARWGQVLGDTFWATIEREPTRRRRRNRAAILRRGPLSVEAEHLARAAPPPPGDLATDEDDRQ